MNDYNNRSLGSKPTTFPTSRKTANPSKVQDYSSRNASNNKASGSRPFEPRKNPDIECYTCGQKGHISSDPKCPKYHLHQSRLQLNAQRLIDGNGTDVYYDSWWDSKRLKMTMTRDKTKREPLSKATLGEDHNTSLKMTSMNAK